MADTPVFESSVIRIGRSAGSGSVILTDESATTKLIVRAADDTSAAAALGLDLGSSEARGDVLVSRIRPDEWMVLGPAAATASLVGGLDLAGYASTVDITHSRLMLRLTGREAAKVMEKVCSIDFTDNMTPDGACVGASVAKVGCDLIRDDQASGEGPLERSYLILCDRSFGQYMFDALLDAKSEFDQVL